MHTFVWLYHQRKSGYVWALRSGILVLGLALVAPAAYAGMGAGAGGGGSSAGAAAGAGGGGAGAATGAGGGGAGAGGGGGTVHRPNNQTELTTCRRGMVWDSKDQKCLATHSATMPERELTDSDAIARAPSGKAGVPLTVACLGNEQLVPRVQQFAG
jgi:hypothetical protein